MSSHERPPGCDNCKHWRGGFTCEAYPLGIPFPIMRGEVAHLQPLPDDNGIQWERSDRPRGPRHPGTRNPPRPDTG